MRLRRKELGRKEHLKSYCTTPLSSNTTNTEGPAQRLACKSTKTAFGQGREDLSNPTSKSNRTEEKPVTGPYSSSHAPRMVTVPLRASLGPFEETLLALEQPLLMSPCTSFPAGYGRRVREARTQCCTLAWQRVISLANTQR